MKKSWIHVDRLLDCLRLEEVFLFENLQKKQFNFKFYYEEINNIEMEAIIKRVDTKLKILKVF